MGARRRKYRCSSLVDRLRCRQSPVSRGSPQLIWSKLIRGDAPKGARASMSPNDLAQLLTAAFDRAAERLRAAGYEDPWLEDLWARDVVRLLRQRAPEVARRAYEEDARR